MKKIILIIFFLLFITPILSYENITINNFNNPTKFYGERPKLFYDLINETKTIKTGRANEPNKNRIDYNYEKSTSTTDPQSGFLQNNSCTLLNTNNTITANWDFTNEKLLSLDKFLNSKQANNIQTNLSLGRQILNSNLYMTINIT